MTKKGNKHHMGKVIKRTDSIESLNPSESSIYIIFILKIEFHWLKRGLKNY